MTTKSHLIHYHLLLLLSLIQQADAFSTITTVWYFWFSIFFVVFMGFFVWVLYKRHQNRMRNRVVQTNRPAVVHTSTTTTTQFATQGGTIGAGSQMQPMKTNGQPGPNHQTNAQAFPGQQQPPPYGINHPTIYNNPVYPPPPPPTYPGVTSAASLPGGPPRVEDPFAKAANSGT